MLCMHLLINQLIRTVTTDYVTDTSDAFFLFIKVNENLCFRLEYAMQEPEL